MPSRRATARLVTALLVGLATLSPAVAALDAAEYERATSTILCDCGCHPQSVHDCACSRAAEMRDEIRAQIEQGRTGDEVIADYVARFGESIRIAPVASGFNLLAWLGPFAALLGAVGALLLVARRWVRSAAPAPADADAAGAAVPADEVAYHERLRREVEELR